MNLPSKFRRILRLAGWNALLLTAGLAPVVLIGEAGQRSTVPFQERYMPKVFVPGVGPLTLPDTETSWTNHLDFWVVSRTNSLGFLDREPPSPERAAESCYIAIISDNTLYADPFVTLDVRARYDIGTWFGIFGEVRNLADETYASSTLIADQARPDQAAFLPGDGRAFSAGVEVLF